MRRRWRLCALSPSASPSWKRCAMKALGISAARLNVTGIRSNQRGASAVIARSRIWTRIEVAGRNWRTSSDRFLAMDFPVAKVVAERPEKFTKVVTAAEKKLLEELLERSLGVTRRRPVRVKAEGTKTAVTRRSGLRKEPKQRRPKNSARPTKKR